ncbi:MULTISPECIES: hypothetical protein [Brevibacillus]|jgi:hypothetical protein|uniref:hypothetical protein n=1 Tax=Brevibacillus TaxID=55080 RepID=UPI0005682580|nr:hypothetical protein [Brevibacillus borstelensis]MCC0564080.1 hypothetical protein [Brevibacillus borstelensis]MCM3470802.1 hypothetical protein [Brevibacillus borstelensis]MCM3592235.1 hypothetical protein [Brevibacillus borstelensis]MCM3622906.1 hypothetical protein [Brevibacillus borstelensis]MED1743988.1 hypothetical protein [Brevibacillus borstelensis]
MRSDWEALSGGLAIGLDICGIFLYAMCIEEKRTLVVFPRPVGDQRGDILPVLVGTQLFEESFVRYRKRRTEKHDFKYENLLL